MYLIGQDKVLSWKMHRVEIEGGPLVFPDPLQKKLSRWLNGDPQLIQAAELQKVVQVQGN